MEIYNVDFFFYNAIMVSVLYVRAKRTGWKIRPWPETVILKIKFKIQFKEPRLDWLRKWSLTESGSGYTFFWKNKAIHEERIHRVGFAISSRLLKQIPNLPTGVNGRLMKLCLPINDKRFVTIINEYSPTMTCREEIREQF